jgi:hypothetical protein
VDIDDRVLAARIIQDALGGGGLAGIDVGDDADIADVSERSSTGHYNDLMTIGPFPDLSTTKGAPNPTRPGRDYKGDISEIADGAALYSHPTRKAKSRVRYLDCTGRIFKME